MKVIDSRTRVRLLVVMMCILCLNYRIRIPNLPGVAWSESVSASHFDWYTDSGQKPIWLSTFALTFTFQNDLSEYFSLLNFANPNFLGTKNDFRKNFENAIIRGRDAMASDQVKAESEKKLKELGGLVMKFIIRRTNDLLSKYCGFRHHDLHNIFYLQFGCDSACQIRTSGFLRSIRLPASSISFVYYLSGNQSTFARSRLSTPQGDQHFEEAM